jgi:hypothetical protein
MILAAVLAIAVCHGQQIIDFERLNSQLLSIITNRTVDDETLLQAISRLGRISEPPNFWLRIADDESYSIRRRRRAIFALLRRHGPATCLELSRMISSSKWAHDAGVVRITHLAGKIPVDFNLPETVFRVSVLDGSGFYLRLPSGVEGQVVESFLRGGEAIRSHSALPILQYGYDDDYDEWLSNRNGNVPARRP